MLVKIGEDVISTEHQIIALKFSPGELALIRGMVNEHPDRDTLVIGPQDASDDSLIGFVTAAEAEPEAVEDDAPAA